jgi:UDP-2,3-diacylglucosamine pyrophosphatase LpxH
MSFGEIEVVPKLVHETADGRRLLLIHGDIFDQVTRHHRWVAVLGDKAYNWLVRLNLWLSWARRKLGRSGYWSLAGYAKRKVKTALNFIFDFEDSAVHHARERGLDGIVCGHIHWAAIKRDRRPPVHQLRRLGRFLHRHRRALRRAPGAGRVGLRPARPGAGCRQDSGACRVPAPGRRHRHESRSDECES